MGRMNEIPLPCDRCPYLSRTQAEFDFHFKSHHVDHYSDGFCHNCLVVPFGTNCEYVKGDRCKCSCHKNNTM